MRSVPASAIAVMPAFCQVVGQRINEILNIADAAPDALKRYGCG